jgi:hypothetical protein
MPFFVPQTKTVRYYKQDNIFCFRICKCRTELSFVAMGVTSMKRYAAFLFGLCLALLSLAACSGLKTSGGGGGGNNNATLNLTFTDTPPNGVSILSFTVTLSGVALDPISGSMVNIPLTPNPLTVELTRLQSDSLFFGSFQVSAATYKSMSVAFTASSLTFFNGSGAIIGSCPNQTICTLQSNTATNVSLATGVFPLTLTGNQQIGLSLDFNLSKAISSSLGVDFTQAGALAVVKLPRTGELGNTLDEIEDFTGIVTSVSGNNIKIQSGTRGTITATADATTQFDNFDSVCPSGNISCVKVNQTLSIDSAVNADGTLSLREADLLDSTAVDEIEGTVFLTNNSVQFGMVLSEKVVASGDIALTGAVPGNLVTVQLENAPAFDVDQKNLTIPPGALGSFQGKSDTSALLNGQTVMVHVTSATSGSNLVVNTDHVRLRYTRTTGLVSSSPAAQIFSINSLPPFFGSLSPDPQVETFQNQTIFDGVTDINGLSVGNTVSIRALYLRAVPALYVVKVRKH